MNRFCPVKSPSIKIRSFFKKTLPVVYLAGLGLPCCAQQDIKSATIDTTLSPAFKSNEKKPQWKCHVLPLSLIISGTALNFGKIKVDLQKGIKKTDTHIDDYIQYAPIATLYLADALGVKHKNTIWNQTKYLIISEFITGVVTQGVKRITNIDRPDGTAHAFPSGHSSLAFAGAEALRKEFKDSNPYWAYSGYLFATSTSVLRLTNYRHWISDVLAGAGLGILVTQLVYYFEPLKSWDPFSSDKKKSAITPSLHLGPTEKSIGLIVRF